MQIASSKYIAERILWYWAKLYCSQISRGEQYGKLHKTIAILFAVEPISNLKDIIEFKTKWQIREENHHTLLLTDALEIYIISLDKLQEMQKNKTLENTALSQCAKFILAPEKLEKDMENNENIKNAKNIYDEINEDEHEKYLAELRQKYIMDMHDFEETGFDKGIEQGIEKGKKETIISLIRNSLNINLPIEKIAQIAGLSIEEINKIIKENNL